MGYNRFGVGLVLRLSVIVIAILVLVQLLAKSGYQATTLLSTIIAFGAIIELFRFISKTNSEVTRFLDAVRYADFGQRFEFGTLGSGFKELGATFTAILDRFRQERQESESELRHLKALLEHVPVPLIAIHTDKRVSLWNNSARRLFGTKKITRTSDMASFGVEFLTKIDAIQAGQQVLATFKIDDAEQRLTISASEIAFAGTSERLISLQNIQPELDGVQLNAWQDLVRVLTHEIMNSITPIASLTKTTVNLVDDVSAKLAHESALLDELADIKAAVNTVSRRSDGLMHFVSSYRLLTRQPEPEKSRFNLEDLFADTRRMLNPVDDKISLKFNVHPNQLDLFADRQMIEQILINLLQNSVHALADMEDGEIVLSAKLNPRGKVSMVVSDNGPGISEQLISRIFVPFFTTRKDGSGVGLALSRQVMLAHGGTISFVNKPSGGAQFTLVF